MRRISICLITRQGRHIVLRLSCLLVFAAAALSQGAGPYEISWYTIDGGGGTSAGGDYVLTGTIGQTDAGWMSGGDYELLGGFWPGGAVPPTGVCCYVPGDRVRLLVDNPHDAVGLPAGALGTVLCCDSDDPDRPIFVSWDRWFDGYNRDLDCDVRPWFYPNNSAWWMACDQLELASEEGYFDGCGVLVREPEGYVSFHADAGGRYLTDNDYDFQVGDRIHVRGVVVFCLTFVGEVDGCIHHPIVSQCAEVPCCDPPYSAGDRVLLLVDNPHDAVGLLAGALGTVLCCDSDDPDLPIFVSWDGWANGRNNDWYCDVTPNPYPANSGWWMACDEIAPFAP